VRRTLTAMRTDGGPATALVITLSATVLLWPALWNGYPLVFADTGTYLSQAVERYFGWDRPIFYSLFLFPLHMTLTTWPAIMAQALLVAYAMHMVRRILLPATAAWWLLPGVALLSIATALPWIAAQLMPDIFTPLLVLVLAMLILVPEQLSPRERLAMVAFATFMIAAHLSHLPLALVLLLVLLPLRLWLGAAAPLGRRGLMAVSAPLVLAVALLMTINIAGFGRAAVSPYGNMYLLARIIYDGPGRDVLRRHCPQSGWQLCTQIDRLPSTSDEFLWREDGPVVAAGGAKLLSTEADAIIAAALWEEPLVELRMFTMNALEQGTRFASGDGLQAWPVAVTPWIAREFPQFEYAAYAAARQTREKLEVPSWLQAIHAGVALLGVAGCGLVLPLAIVRRQVIAGFASAVLLALLTNATITGGLSGPQDRYQCRLMWLAPLIVLIAIANSCLAGRAARTLGPLNNDAAAR
jgi:hypothetical protein